MSCPPVGQTIPQRNYWLFRAPFVAHYVLLVPIMHNGWIVEGYQDGTWAWEHVAGTVEDATYATEEGAQGAIDSLVETCGWSRDGMRVRERVRL